ncbi:lipid A-modifier LpxR family protein [uncultured Roseovarius sp.]|uniref:lipid A-modifier LpxR family protein n=1 Tax=uncultured Roseovarius sp. TaxID=293344 RepID=UPI0025CFA698|nr:lipid A-modifier LpxR family protein [uncultured Roseovarius sp.]
MMRLFAAALAFGLSLSALQVTPAQAEDRGYLGHGRLITNDVLGDGYDRWRTGSVALSYLWGPDWQGQRPDAFGQMLELRFNAEILGPENLFTPAAGDRPYAQAFTMGLHSHFMAGEAEVALGGDVTVTGPQLGFDDVQEVFHDALGGRDPSPATKAAQISNDVHATAVMEMGRTYRFRAGGTALRPFVEARVGVETMVRAGADVMFGGLGQGGLMLREPVTGQLYKAIDDDTKGLKFVLGGDVAYVADSIFLPSSRGYRLTDTRNRLRAGVHWEGAKGSKLFYGVTWLDKEFKAQRETQVVGSVRLDLKF